MGQPTTCPFKYFPMDAGVILARPVLFQQLLNPLPYYDRRIVAGTFLLRVLMFIPTRLYMARNTNFELMVVY